MPRCATASGCHGRSLPSEGLDFTVPNLESVLTAKTSTTIACMGRRILIPGDPDGSLIYTKLLDPPPCGARMPFRTTPLDDTKRDVIRAWIQSL